MLAARYNFALVLTDFSQPRQNRAAIYLDLLPRQGGSTYGIFSVELDPNFSANGYIYLFWSPNKETRVSRFTHAENSGALTSRASLESEVVLFKQRDGCVAAPCRQ